jgi:hypothetical protein
MGGTMDEREAFSKIIEGQFPEISDLEEMSNEKDDDKPVYGLRILFFNVDTQAVRTVLMPWLTYDQRRAEKMRTQLLGPRADILLPMLYRAYPQACPLHWIPVGIRTVRLAEIPF